MTAAGLPNAFLRLTLPRLLSDLRSLQLSLCREQVVRCCSLTFSSERHDDYFCFAFLSAYKRLASASTNWRITSASSALT